MCSMQRMQSIHFVDCIGVILNVECNNYFKKFLITILYKYYYNEANLLLNNTKK